MGKKTIVIDTNIIISAFGWRGIPRTTFLNAITNHTLYTSEKQLEELKRALNYPKLKLTKLQQEQILAFIQKTIHIINPKTTPKRSRDPTDDHILAIAQAARADYLITGDKDLLTLNTHQHTKIVTPKTFLKS